MDPPPDMTDMDIARLLMQLSGPTNSFNVEKPPEKPKEEEEVTELAIVRRKGKFALIQVLVKNDEVVRPLKRKAVQPFEDIFSEEHNENFEEDLIDVVNLDSPCLKNFETRPIADSHAASQIVAPSGGPTAVEEEDEIIDVVTCDEKDLFFKNPNDPAPNVELNADEHVFKVPALPKPKRKRRRRY